MDRESERNNEKEKGEREKPSYFLQTKRGLKGLEPLVDLQNKKGGGTNHSFLSGLDII